MVNDGLTCQEQSWVSDAPNGTQLVFIPAAQVDNCKVTTIIEEHKLFFNLHIIALMFTQEPQLCTTWDVHQSVQPNTCNIDQGIHDALVAPTTSLYDGDINLCICRYVRRHSSDLGQTNGQTDVFVSMFGCSSSDARSG